MFFRRGEDIRDLGIGTTGIGIRAEDIPKVPGAVRPSGSEMSPKEFPATGPWACP